MKRNDIKTADIVERYQSGATAAQVAVEFGCHVSLIYARLKAAGVARRRKQASPNGAKVQVRIFVDKRHADWLHSMGSKERGNLLHMLLNDFRR